ncbi:MAG TPA: 4Fe-4S binding protein [Firmicutes bacterium]|nr:4Fe-4S binding protein [Bacillota bacterium]
MADLSVELLGVRLKSPFLLSSGPLSHSGEALLRAYAAGAGAVVTKTIRLKKADNPFPHMVRVAPGTLLNAEKWSDIEADRWINEEIPRARAGGAVVVGSVGHTAEEARTLVGPVAIAGCSLIELVSYDPFSMVPMVEEARKQTSLPILAKVSPGWPDLARVAARCRQAGADGITAGDSLGPTLRLDLASGRPLLGSDYGFGWLSGAAIFPIALRSVAEIALGPGGPVVGVGGVMKAEDALEMLYAGATAVGICTAAIMFGNGIFEKLNRGLAQLLDERGMADPAAARGFSLPHLVPGEHRHHLTFSYDAAACTDCKRCQDYCPYGARKVSRPAASPPPEMGHASRSSSLPQMSLDEELCRYCGYCVSICPPHALKATW